MGQTCTKHNSSSLGPEPFVHKLYIARLWHGNLTAVMDFACAKGPSIVTDGFDMVVIRTSATNGSMSLWGGDFEPRVPLLCWLKTFATWDCVVGNVGCAFSFISCYTWHTAYSWGNTHSPSVNSRNVVCTFWSVDLADLLFIGGLDWPADLNLMFLIFWVTLVIPQSLLIFPGFLTRWFPAPPNSESVLSCIWEGMCWLFGRLCRNFSQSEL